MFSTLAWYWVFCLQGTTHQHWQICSLLIKCLCLCSNRAIRVITKSSYDTSSRLLLNSLDWDNLSCRRAKQKANLTYKCINNLAPADLCNLFVPRIPNYDFRNAEKSYYSQNQEASPLIFRTPFFALRPN